MKYSDYVKLDMQLKAQLAQRNQGMYLVREAICWAGAMALVLSITDATPWSLFEAQPLVRLGFILAWAIAMARWRLRQAGTRSGQNPKNLPRYFGLVTSSINGGGKRRICPAVRIAWRNGRSS